MLGVNYWGRDYGTEMWRHYDGKAIREELKKLAEYGVRCMRVFPNWRDFQPIDANYCYQGDRGEYVNANTGKPVYDDGVDMDRIADFRDFCHAAEQNGMTLVVSVVTGWMSGRLFVPPVLKGKNLITDPEARMLMRRFIHRFVKELKNEKCIVMWDLGNECNCMGVAETEFEAYEWTAAVTDAIRSEDKTRPISSGMHSLEAAGIWKIQHQGELCDMLSTHPYPSPTVGGSKEPYTRLRMSYLPTAQSLYYSGVGKKPAYIQESGTFTQALGNREMSADFMRMQILSALTSGLAGYQWWCAWNQGRLDFSPYTWSMIERELGLFDDDGNPKPVAFTMQKMSKALENLPSPYPKRRADGVCVLSYSMEHQNIAISSLIMAKQAGIDLDVAFSEGEPLPESSLYFMPSVSGWSVMRKPAWEFLLERVRGGATLCISFDGGQLTDFPAVVGAESMGFMTQVSHSFTVCGETTGYYGNEILLKPTTAEVLLENEGGNPVVLKNKYGNGHIYFINFSPERISFDTADGYNKYPYYRLYEMVAGDVASKKEVTVNDKNLGVTINPESDTSLLVSVLNYSDKEIKPDIKISDGWSIKDILYGDPDTLPMCDGVIMRITKD